MESQQVPSIPSNLSGYGNPMDYVSTVLKSQFGNSEEFLAFERYFYYQTEELNSVKNTCEELRATVSKLQEEKRSFELQLVSEKALRDQESKNAAMEIEKNNVQQNAQIYTMKCEVESWKRKSEAITTECTWLKDQMKTVEIEKNQAVQKLTELKSSMSDYNRYRQSFESYSRRLKESIQSANKKLDELEKAKDCFENLHESNQNQLDMMTSRLLNWNDEREKFQKKMLEQENELVKTKAELVQNNSKLSRAEMTEKKTAELVNQLLEENQDLLKGLCILSQAVGDKICEVDQQLIEKTKRIHDQIDHAVKRLYLKESDFSPPSNSN